MFCQSCGFQNIKEVNYCNRCGKQLKPRASYDKTMSDLITRFLTTIGTVTGVGMGLPTFVLLALGKKGFPPHILMVVAIVAFAATVLVDGLLVWLLLKVMRMRQEEPHPARSTERITNGLSEKQIAAPPLFASVTEHTTRNFDPALPGAHRREEWRSE